MAIFYQFLIAFIFSLSQVLFIYLKGYFLSIEFTLYPYLISKGFVPYTNILDQHFPSLFFGTFSIPFFSAQSPLPLQALFAVLLIVTNLLFFNYLRVKKVSNLYLWLGLFIVTMNYFSANVLWVETFIVFLLAIVLNISDTKNKLSYLLSGFIFSQIILLRPTLIISVVIISIFLKLFKKEFILGIIGGFILSFYYLISHGIIAQFFNLTFIFNASEYAKSSVIFPTKIQLISILLLVFYTAFAKFNSASLLLFFATVSSLLAAFPRFGLEHLQPFVLLSIISASSVKNKSIILPTVVLMFFSFLLIFGLSKHRYGNYFYQPHLYSLADKISKLPGGEVYLFGSTDLLYPFSNKVPPKELYIPSLPWYLNYPQFQSRLLISLSQSNAPVVVDTSFRVDDKKLTDEASVIYNFVKMNYNLLETAGNYEIYTKKQ